MRRLVLVTALGAGVAIAACGEQESLLPSPPRAASGGVDLPPVPAFAFYATPSGYAAEGAAYHASVDTDGERIVVGSARAGSPALTLRTTSIAREDRVLWRSTATRAATLRGGRIELPRGVATERIDAGARAVEQSWVFREAPPGDGDLFVHVKASGGLRLRAAADGIHAESRGASVAYRNATWIDDSGKRTPLALALEGDDIVVRVPADTIATSSFPATLDPTIGPELAIDQPIVSTSYLGSYSSRVTAGKGGNALVVWADSRVEAPFANSLFSGETLLATRISPAGTVLDPTGILVSPERDFYHQDYAIAYDGTKNWFVASLQTGLNAPCDELWGAIIDDTGALVSSKPTQGACIASGLAVGFDGTSFVVAFTVRNDTQGVYASRFSTTGQPLDTVPVQIGAAPVLGNGGPAFGCRAGGCLVAWRTSAGVRAARLGAGLAVLDATPIVVTNTASLVTGVVFDGQSWVVSAGTQLTRIDPATGALVGAPLSVGADDIDAIATDGTQTWAVWNTAANQISGARMTQAGALAPGMPFAVTTGASLYYSDPKMAFGGGVAYVTWDDNRLTPNGNIFAARVSSAGAPLDGDGFPLDQAVNGQINPSVASSGKNYLVAWSDYRASADVQSTYAARLALDGTPLDGVATLVEPKAVRTVTASDGTDYLVVSEVSVAAGSPIRAVRISGTTGAVLGPAVDLAANGSRPSITHDGTQYVVAWIEAGGVRAARVSNAGTAVGGTIMVSPSPNGAREGSATGVASNGASTLVMFNDADIRGVRIGLAGEILDASPIMLATSTGKQYFPKVTWDGVQWVVVWEDYRAGYIIDPEIFAARISPAGVVLSPSEVRVGTSPQAQVFPAVIGMNDGYADLVVWSDNRNPARSQDFAIMGSWLRRSDGKVLDQDAVLFSDRVGNEMGAALAPAGPGRALLAYHAVDYTPGMGNARVRVRFVGSGVATGQACTKNDDCATRACADGICCDRACTGTCETCAATAGTCTPVTLAEDPDTCAGDSACSAASKCQRKKGQGCVLDADCATGICAKGICCDRRCDAPCETCAAGVGTCTLSSPRSPGAPTCAPYACDGVNAACPASCTSDVGCPAGSRCETASGVCVSGASCLDDRTALLDDQSGVDCTPYTCGAGACRTSCRSVDDCSWPAVCDEGGRCVVQPAASEGLRGGCSARPARTRTSVGSALLAAFALALLYRRRSAAGKNR